MAKIIGVIDDDDAVRDSIQALLDSYGYEVRGYASAERFLSSVATPADCLLVDQHMPGISGLDLLERLRSEGNTTPAIMITGRDDKPLHARAEQIGISVFQKPMPEDVLIATIEQALGH